jgi:hypothetical protein
MDRLSIRSGAVILRDGKILLENGELIGGWIKEGEGSEGICKKKASEIGIELEIARPLSPRIEWKINNNGEKCAIVNLNYLGKEKNGR